MIKTITVIKGAAFLLFALHVENAIAAGCDISTATRTPEIRSHKASCEAMFNEWSKCVFRSCKGPSASDVIRCSAKSRTMIELARNRAKNRCQGKEEHSLELAAKGFRHLHAAVAQKATRYKNGAQSEFRTGTFEKKYKDATSFSFNASKFMSKLKTLDRPRISDHLSKRALDASLSQYKKNVDQNLKQFQRSAENFAHAYASWTAQKNSFFRTELKNERKARLKEALHMGDKIWEKKLAREERIKKRKIKEAIALSNAGLYSWGLTSNKGSESRTKPSKKHPCHYRKQARC